MASNSSNSTDKNATKSMHEIQSHVNQLYHLDREEADLRAALKVVTDKVKVLKTTLLSEIKTNQLEKRPFVIGDRMIKYKMVKDTESLSQKYLKQALSKYFEDNPIEAKNLFDFIVSSRNSKYTEVIDGGARPASIQGTQGSRGKKQ